MGIVENTVSLQLLSLVKHYVNRCTFAYLYVTIVYNRIMYKLL